MSEKYFELSNLSVGYNKKTLIEDICLDIKKGEIVTLIGKTLPKETPGL